MAEAENIIEITSKAQIDEAVKSEKLTIVDFWAVWCGPCRVLKPTIKEVASEHSEIKVVSIDVDKCGGLATKYG